MAEYGRWGWHRLDSRWIARLIHASRIEAGDLVVDVGAGDGRITRELVRRGASVIAVELHPHRASALRSQFSGDRVVVVRADAADLRLPRRPFKVVANPPFATTTALLRRLTAPNSRLEAASLVVPSWAVARWTAGRGVGGATSKRLFGFERGDRVPAYAFSPPPPRDAAILLVHRR